MPCSLHDAAKTQRPLAATQGGRLAGHDAQRVFQAQPNIHVYGYCFDVATLTDPPTIVRHMADFKGWVLAALGLQL